jgi:hypothetical protein
VSYYSLPTMALLLFGLLACGDDGVARDAGSFPDALPDASIGADAGSSELAIDCTSRDVVDERCNVPSEIDPGSIGEGPMLANGGLGPLFGVVYEGGFVDSESNRLVVALPSAGVILGVDLTTGDRAVLSGVYRDPRTGPTTVGAGDPIDGVFDVRAGPDGWYARVADTIVRVDPATGDRTVVWTDAAPCVEYLSNLRSLAVDEAGTAYVHFFGMSAGAESAGIGAIRDGACTTVTRSSTDPSLVVGGGLDVNGEGWGSLHYGTGKVHALFLESLVLEVDVATGDRRAITSAAVGSGPVAGGTGMAVGERSIWTVSSEALQVVEIDRATGDRIAREPHPDTPFARVLRGPSRVWIHPNGVTLVLAFTDTLFLFDPPTGNDHVLSR